MRISDWSSDVCSSDLFPQNCRRDFGALEFAAAFEGERRGGFAKFGWKIAGREVHVHTDAKNDVVELIQFREHLGQNAADLSYIHQAVVGPLEFRTNARDLLE